MEPFEQLTKSLDPAMVVVTTAAEGVRAGCMVGFHGEAGIEPQQYAVWLSKANHTYRVAMRATHLAVHALTPDDLALAERFGTVTGEDEDKFAGFDTTEGPGGLPLLAALPHRLVGRRLAVLDANGDHALFALGVEQVDSPGAFEPLRLSAVDHLDAGHDADERAISPEG